MKRKKRLKKGIESLKKQIEIHEDKLEEAKKRGNEELTRYYEGEIEKMEERKENRVGKLRRRK